MDNRMMTGLNAYDPVSCSLIILPVDDGSRNAYMQRSYLPSLLARHRHVTRKRAALDKLLAYAIRRAAARAHAINVLYMRSLQRAIQRQNYVQNEELLCEAASEYHTERSKRKAVPFIEGVRGVASQYPCTLRQAGRQAKLSKARSRLYQADFYK